MLTALITQEEPQPGRNARVWLIPAVTLVAVGVNAIAAMVGAQAGQDQTQTLVEPASYAFSIWGVIFLANLVFAAYQALPGQREDPLLDHAAMPYVAGQAFAALFALAALIDAHTLAQVSTLLYFAAAVATYAILGVGRRDDGWARRLCAWLPASISMAWLLVASIVVLANVLVVERAVNPLVDVETSPPVGTPESWAVGAIVSAALVATGLLVWRRDFAFAAVTSWSLVAIGRAQQNEAVDSAVIASLAIIGLVALGMVPKATAGVPWRPTTGRRARAH